MRNSRVIPILCTLFLVLLASCQDRKTYAEYLKDESRAIDRFIAQNDIDILEKFPEDSTFKSNEFYKDPTTGVYYNIVDFGNKNEKISLGEEVYIRFKGLSYFMTDDTTSYSNLNPSTSPYPQTLVFQGAVTTANKSYYATPGWMVPVPAIGHKGIVKLIVPFEMGSSYDQSQYQATYYDHVEYRYESYY